MRRIYYLALACVGTLTWQASGEACHPLDESWQALATITGFHNFVDTATNMNVRLLEVNGEATVAINPVTLYIVVTNNSAAGDLQEHVWHLPFRIDKIGSGKQIRTGMLIKAVQEGKKAAGQEARRHNNHLVSR